MLQGVCGVEWAAGFGWGEWSASCCRCCSIGAWSRIAVEGCCGHGHLLSQLQVLLSKFLTTLPHPCSPPASPQAEAVCDSGELERRWRAVLARHAGSPRLWRAYLHHRWGCGAVDGGVGWVGCRAAWVAGHTVAHLLSACMALRPRVPPPPAGARSSRGLAPPRWRPPTTTRLRRCTGSTRGAPAKVGVLFCWGVDGRGGGGAVRDAGAACWRCEGVAQPVGPPSILPVAASAAACCCSV